MTTTIYAARKIITMNPARPTATHVAVRDGRIRPGDHVMMLGVGGGFTWGSVLVRWS